MQNFSLKNSIKKGFTIKNVLLSLKKIRDTTLICGTFYTLNLSKSVTGKTLSDLLELQINIRKGINFFKFCNIKGRY